MATLRFHQVQKTYADNVPVIHGIDMAIQDGEFIVIVGPSGCGKSTLLRMVAGLESVTRGEILIDDQVINEREPADRDIAMVFQNYALYPHMSVFENMAYGLKIRKLSAADIRQRVDTAATMLELSHLLDRRPRALSGGQRQRVAMGRAIVREPKVFLFDEPLSNLDAKLRVAMRLEIMKLHQRLRTTSLYVTHDQIEAMTLAQRMIVMNQGIAEQIGTPMDIFNEPASTFVASFIGSPPMNLIDVQISASGTVQPLEGIALDLPQHAIPPTVRAKKSILGIRPEHMVLHAPGLSVQVEMLETLGSEQLVHCRCGHQALIVRSPLSPSADAAPKVGDKITLGVNEHHGLHWFDPETKKRISALG